MTQARLVPNVIPCAAILPLPLREAFVQSSSALCPRLANSGSHEYGVVVPSGEQIGYDWHEPIIWEEAEEAPLVVGRDKEGIGKVLN
jgi:hypothetical protein